MQGNVKIYKYPIPGEGSFSIMMPRGAEILCIQTQKEAPCIWAMVHPDEPIEHRRFRLVGTGHDFDKTPLHTYIGTFQLLGGSFMGHLFSDES